MMRQKLLREVHLTVLTIMQSDQKSLVATLGSWLITQTLRSKRWRLLGILCMLRLLKIEVLPKKPGFSKVLRSLTIMVLS